MSTDDSPDTEEQLTSQDFIKEGPIERGLEFPRNCANDREARELFKAMAFEADKEAKRLQERVTELESRLATASSTLVSVSGQEAKYRAALLDIEGRITNWADDNWLEPGMAKGASVLVANILAVVRRVK